MARTASWQTNAGILTPRLARTPAKTTIVETAIESMPWLVLGLLAGAALGLIDALVYLLSGYQPGVVTSVIVTVACIGLNAGLGALLGLLIALFSVAGKLVGFVRSSAGIRYRGSKPLRPLFVLLLGFTAMTASLFVMNSYLLHSEEFGITSELAGISILGAGVVFVGAAVALESKAPRFLWIGWVVLATIVYLTETRLLYQFSKYGDLRSIYTYALIATFLSTIICVVLASPRLWKMARRWPPLITLFVTAIGAVALFNGRGALLSISDVSSLAVFERTRLTSRTAEFSSVRGFDEAAVARDCEITTVPSLPRSRHTEIGVPLVTGVLVIFVDALRNDRLTKSYHGAAVTKRLNDLAARSTRFERSYATVPATRRAFLSIVSGTDSSSSIPEERPFPLLLAKSNVKTMMASLHPLLGVGSEIFGDYLEFGDPDHNKRNHTSKQSFLMAQKILRESKGSPFFAFVHFYDPHEHYISNAMFDFGAGRKERYDAEVALTDFHIGRVLDELETQGLADSTAVIVISDHGEELGEHEYFWHRLRLYDESTRLAHVVHVPGTPPRHFEQPVSLLDIAPTVLDLLGQRMPAHLPAWPFPGPGDR